MTKPLPPIPGADALSSRLDALIRARGLLSVVRSIQLPANTLATVLEGTARPATMRIVALELPRVEAETA